MVQVRRGAAPAARMGWGRRRTARGHAVCDRGTDGDQHHFLAAAGTADVTCLKTFHGAVDAQKLGHHGKLIDDERRRIDISYARGASRNGPCPLANTATVDAGDTRKVDYGLGAKAGNGGLKENVFIDDALNFQGRGLYPLQRMFAHAFQTARVGGLSPSSSWPPCRRSRSAEQKATSLSGF